MGNGRQKASRKDANRNLRSLAIVAAFFAGGPIGRLRVRPMTTRPARHVLLHRRLAQRQRIACRRRSASIGGKAGRNRPMRSYSGVVEQRLDHVTGCSTNYDKFPAALCIAARRADPS